MAGNVRISPALAARVQAIPTTGLDWRVELARYLTVKIRALSADIVDVQFDASRGVLTRQIQLAIVEAMQLRAEAQTVGMTDALKRLGEIDRVSLLVWGGD